MSPRLLALQRLLSPTVARSAAELARKAKCSLPAVYRRLNSLALAGAIIVEVRTPRHKPGPTPRKFRLAKPVDTAMANRP